MPHDVFEEDAVPTLDQNGRLLASQLPLSVASASSDAAGNVTDVQASGTSVYVLRDNADQVQRRLVGGVFSDIQYLKGRAVVALGSDDGPSQDYTILWPIIRANNLPWTLAVCAPGATTDGSTNSVGIGLAGRLTWAQVQEMRDYGCEVACHSRSHLDPTVHGGNPNFVDETVNAAAVLAAGNSGVQYNVDMFVQPGTWTGNYFMNAAALIDPPDIKGQYLRSRFHLATAYVQDNVGSNTIHRLPVIRRYGIVRGHSWDSDSLATIQQAVKLAMGQGGLVSIIGHSFNLDQGGFNTTAVATSILTYLAAQRDAGNIELMTLSAAYNARPSSAGRWNILNDGDFHMETAGAPGTFVGWLASGSPTIIAAGAQVGTKPTGNTASLIINTAGDTVTTNLAGPALRNLRIEFDARTGNGSAKVSQEARIIVRGQDSSFATVQNIDTRTGGATGPQWAALTTAWVHYVLQVAIDPQATGNVIIWPFIFSASGSGVEYANFQVSKQ